MINGIINVYKEKGFTSHDVVAKLRGITKQKKIGHTGTLDPDAEGVLPVCFGNATKLCDMITDKTKEYEAVMLLGINTDTQDASGKVINESDLWQKLTGGQVTEAIMSFVGEYDQIPPMYSALKINGQKLYELARKGETVERKARRVTIDKIDIVDIKLPRVTMRVSCSKGTYIRTLCNDIGEKLGCYACMEKLLRTKVGKFYVNESLKLSKIQELTDQGQINSVLISTEEMFDYSRIYIKESSSKVIYNGNIFLDSDIERTECKDKENISINCSVKVYDYNGRFIGVYEKLGNKYKPVKMFFC